MGDVPVVDAHVHFWDPALLRYPGLDGLPQLQRPFLPSHLPSLASGAVHAVVVVEANCLPAESAAEVAFAQGLADAGAPVAGLVAFVDLLDEPARLRTVAQLERRPLVVGVRHNIQGQCPGFALQPAFVRGVQAVGEHGLTFDLCATAGQLSDVRELVRQCPDTRFVLDHCGKPTPGGDAFDQWAADLARLAAHGNISCKLSGLFTEAPAELRGDAALLPFANHVLRSFGPARLLYGSDWPVVTLAGGEAAWRDFTDRFTAGWTPDERRDFYGGTAVRVYNLKLDVH